jgi:SAM-dependent methyltransferase
MSFFSTLQNWEYLAKKDPLWAILSDPAKKNGRWEVGEFFASGRNEIDNTLAHLAQHGFSPTRTKVAIDFGCGVGRLSRALSAHFEKVYGVDAAPTMVEQARTLNAEHQNIEFVLNQEPHLARFADESVSFVYSALVLQHITYPESLRYVEELMRVLEPGGVAVFQTPTVDRTPLPLRWTREAIRRLVRTTRLPIDALYIDMNTIPVAEIERVARARNCELIERINVNRQTIGDGGALLPLPEPLFERLVSEQFVARKRRS